MYSLALDYYYTSIILLTPPITSNSRMWPDFLK